jgi:1-acyl-sn-glycerol-3-phosphate acyltransferase
MLYSILRLLSAIILKILFRFKAKGLEHVPKRGGFILASNHVSYLDPIAVGVACQRKLNYMAKEELFCNPLFSRLLSRIGVFPVKRDSADLSALKEAMRRVRIGGALVLFPEGSRRFDGASHEPYSGIGFLAAKLNVPVIPAFVKGTEKALPAGAKFIRLTNISVCFGKQISIERRMPYQDIAGHIMDNIRHLSC